MITLMLVGAGLGGCLFWLVLILAPPKPSPLVALGRFDAHRRGELVPAGGAPTPAGHTRAAVDVQARAGRWLAHQLARHGFRFVSLRHDLALTGRSFDTVMGSKVVGAVGGFLLALLVLSWLRYGRGLMLPSGAAWVIALLVATVAFLAPDLDLRKEARRRRAEFTESLSVFLELVSLEMAGYAAAETALPEAAKRGGTWAMLLIRDTLLRARLAGEDTWDALADLGQRIGVPDLRELGSLIKNVADDGAQVRRTLSARAASMRRARLAAEEGAAAQRSQSMRLAQLLIAIGFALFIGYPAFVNIQF